MTRTYGPGHTVNLKLTRGSMPKGVVGRGPEISSGEDEIWSIHQRCRTIMGRIGEYGACRHESGEEAADSPLSTFGASSGIRAW
eukprot:3442020-Pleurochrysis_carterae.AAC.1